MGQHGDGSGSVTGCRYAIRVEGLLDDHWRQWLDGMTITHEGTGISRLEMDGRRVMVSFREQNVPQFELRLKIVRIILGHGL